jgi:carbon monoxide dehydrogenase subunit G
VASLTRSVTIDRPIEDVFAVVTDVTKTGRWFPGDVVETWTTPPPHGVGSIRHAVVTVMGRRAENDATVVEFDPPHRGVMAGEQQGVKFQATITCAEVAEGTRLQMDFEAKAGGAMRFFIGPFMNWYGNAWTTGLANLKQQMEAGEL